MSFVTSGYRKKFFRPAYPATMPRNFARVYGSRYSAILRRRRGLRKGRTQNTVYRYLRTAISTNTNWAFNNTGAVAVVNASQAFTLDLVPNVSEFKNLYDQYRIDKVVVVMKSKGVSNMVNTANAAGILTEMPMFNLVIDYDDDTPLSIENDYLQYQNCRFLNPMKDYRITVQPKVARMVYDGVASTAYSTPTRATWIDIANTDVPHYGIKWGTGPFTLNNIELGWKVYYKFYLSFKNVR